MLFGENLRRALPIFNGLRSRYGQRAFLVYHTASRACDRRLTPRRVPRPASVPHSSPLAWCTMRGQTPRPLIVRQVSSPAASSGCSRPGRRAPRAPVREGQRQRRPAHTSAVASPTASARHGFCSLSLAEAKKPRQDALWCGWREATGVFLFERDTYGHTPPSHHSRPHRGPLPLAVGEGILPLEPEDVQVEAPQECSAYPPWACGRGAW
jgi:hypothetical protein